MTSIALNYDSIYSAAKKAKKVASNAEDYVSGLQKKIINKIDDLVGTDTTYTSNARSKTDEKIKRLNKKKTAYTEYSTKLEKFVDEENIGAKAVDKKVAKMFEKNGEAFRDNNNIKINPVTQFFTFLANEFSNASDFARAISDGFTSVKNWLSDKWDSIKEWCRYEGGKFWVNIGGALFDIAISVIIIVTTITVAIATGGIGIVAICAIVGSVISIANGLIACYSNVKALLGESSDPAWALKQSKIDKYSTFLRKFDTGSSAGNNILNLFASGLDIAEIGCSLVTIVSCVAKLGRKIPVIKNLIGDESKGLLKSLLDKSIRDINNKPVVTFKSLRNGLKTFITDPKARSAILKKFTGDFTTHFNKTTIKDTFTYEWKIRIKQNITLLATSPESRKRYADIVKLDVQKNISKVWNNTIGNLKSGNSNKRAEGYNNLLKMMKVGLGDFSKAASSGDVNIISMDSITTNIKDTYISMDTSAKALSDAIKDINAIKGNTSKVMDNIEKIQGAPAY